MARNYNYMYNYGTSPRKLQPEYTPNRRTKTKPKKQINTRLKNNKAKKLAEEKRLAEEKKKKVKQRRTILYIGIGFAILFAISYRNSQIDENFSKIRILQTDLATIEKENEQLEVNIENSSNLNNLEQAAKELLGMQKLSNKQSVYVTLPKVDYVEGTQNEDTEKEGFFTIITRNILNIF